MKFSSPACARLVAGMLLAACVVGGVSGCRKTVPIHVWRSATVGPTLGAKVALGPVAGNRELAARIEESLMAQRPAARADVALFTAKQLAESCPVRLASTAALNSDVTAIQAARAVGADILLQGEILSADIDLQAAKPPPSKKTNFNQLFFALGNQNKKKKNESILLSWRVLDVQSGKTLGSEVFTLRSNEAAKQYPDLEAMAASNSELLIAASARETWKALSPTVAKEEVRLASPWLQPGAWRVRLGVRAAKQGQWAIAEQHWRRAADLFWLNASAQHNLAIALAAQEDFAGAKQQLNKARGIFAYRLPHETLFWLDEHHRIYNQAHGLGRPAAGWAFPDPEENMELIVAEPIDISELPWWTALPGAKPPDWSWQSWLSQPLVL